MKWSASVEVTFPEGVGSVKVKLYDTDILTVNLSGEVRLDSGGHRTSTTKRWMNKAAAEFGIPIEVYQMKNEWYVWSTSEGIRSDYVDGDVVYAVTNEWTTGDWNGGVTRIGMKRGVISGPRPRPPKV